MANKKMNFEEEFRSSQVYKTLSETGSTVADKVAYGIGKATDAINDALNGTQVNRSSVKYNGQFNYDPHTGKPVGSSQPTPPTRSSQRNTAPPGVNYSSTYTPPAPGSYRPPQAPPVQPQRSANQTYQYPFYQKPMPDKYATPSPPLGVTPVAPPQYKTTKVKNKGAKQVKTQVKQGVQMMEVRKPAVAKYYITGLAAIIYAVSPIPMYQPIHFVVFAAVMIAIFIVSSVLFKGKKAYVEVPVEPMPAAEPSKTGNTEADKIINEGHEYIRKLKQINIDIPDETISGYITRMENASDGIFKYVAEDPDSVPQIRKFMSYYLPTTMKLLTSYHRLDSQKVKGENVTTTMVDIERMLSTVATAFEKQLDSLFTNDAIDIGTDISVFETMLKQEGFAPDNMDITANIKGASQKEAPEAETDSKTAKIADEMNHEIEIGGVAEVGEIEGPTLTLNPKEAIDNE